MRSHRLPDADEFLEVGVVGHVAGKGVNNWASMFICVSVLTRDKGVLGMLLVSCVDFPKLGQISMELGGVV